MNNEVQIEVMRTSRRILIDSSNLHIVRLILVFTLYNTFEFRNLQGEGEVITNVMTEIVVIEQKSEVKYRTMLIPQFQKISQLATQ